MYNLGTGQGYSVLDVVHAFGEVSGRDIPYKIADRRVGDVSTMYSSPEAAGRELGWKAIYGLKDMCAYLHLYQHAVIHCSLVIIN